MAKNLRTKNGIIHVVHDAFFPPIGDIMDVLFNDPDCTTFVHALEITGMQEMLKNGKNKLNKSFLIIYAADRH